MLVEFDRKSEGKILIESTRVESVNEKTDSITVIIVNRNWWEVKGNIHEVRDKLEGTTEGEYV
tara:strand:- start:1439 stop:1627 length:189 start_codon:yes stop_codon:yes gene_type:complete